MATVDRTRFRPYRGTEANIENIPFTDGYVYFATDSGRIYLDYQGERLTMGGNGASLFYATQEEVPKDEYEDIYFIYHSSIAGSAADVKLNDLIINSDGAFYKVYRTDDDNQFWCLKVAVSGTGGGGGGPVVSITDLTVNIDSETLAAQQTLIQGKTHMVSITATSDTDRYVTLSFQFNDATTGYAESFVERAISGEPFELDLSFLPVSKSMTMIVTASADNSRMPTPPSKRVTGLKIVEMGVTKVSRDSYIPVVTSENLSGLALSYIPIGDSTITETLHVYVDDTELVELRKTLTRDNYNRANSVSIPTQEHGVHIVELAVSTTISRTTLYSDRISFEAAWASDDNDTPIIWIGEYDPVVINYENASIPFMVFNPEDYRNGRASEVRLFKNGLQISEIEVEYDPNKWAYWDISAIYEVGSNLLTIQQGISSKELTVTVTTEGSRDLGLIRPNTLLMNYSAAGRSPSELRSARTVWTSTGRQATGAIMEGFNWANNGWVSPVPESADYDNGSYLSIANGATLTIPMVPYSLNNAQDYSFEIRFRVRNVQKYSTLVTTIPTYFYKQLIDGNWVEFKGDDDGVTMDTIRNSNGTMEVLYDEYGSPWSNGEKVIQTTNTTHGIVCRWLDPSTGYGFVIGTQEAFFKSPAKLVSVRYKEDEVINISFVVSVAEHLAYIYLNGIPSGATELPVDAQDRPEPFTVTSNMVFNSDYCDFDLYRMRVYQYGLTIPDVIHNYLSDIHSIALYDQNQLTQATDATQLDYNKLVTYNEEHPDAPTMPYATWKIVKNDEFGRDTLPYYKGDKRTVNVDFFNPPLNQALDNGEITPFEYYCHIPGFHAEDVEIDVQGTSSQAYPRRNYKTKYKKASSWVYNYGPLEGESVAKDHYFDKTTGAWIGKSIEKQAEGEDDAAYKTRMKAYDKLSKNLHIDTINIATNKFTWKIDYMESSGMYNTGFANLMGNLQHPLYLKHPLEDLGLDATEMRTSVYGFPLLTFHEHADGRYEYIGRYNMNLDKSSNEYYGFESKSEHPYVPGKTIAEVAECWELEDNQGSWCSFKFPTDAARETGFGTLQDGSEDRLEVMRHFEYRYSLYGDQIDAIGPEGEYDGSLPSDPEEAAAMSAEIGITDAQKSFYVRNKYYNLERVFYWLDSTDTDKATNEDIIIRTPVMGQDGSVSIESETLASVQYPTSVDYTGIDGATSVLSGSTYITTFTKDSVAYRQAKFANEVNDHFDVHYCIIYFILTELLLCYDSRGKNMMLATWGPHRLGGEFIWYPVFYDIDTQLGLNNSGAYLWDYDADVTMDGLFSTPASVLWTNLYNLFLKDIQNTYCILRGKQDNSKIVNSLTYTNIVGAYECNQDVFGSYAMGGLRPIVAIGLDEYYKYFATTTASGIGYYDTKGNLIKEATPSYAYCCQGDKKLNTELLLRNRLNYIDSWWMGGDYQIDKVKNSELWLRVSGNRSKETSDKFLNLSTEEILQRQTPSSQDESAIAAAEKYQGFSHGDYPVPYLDSVPGFKIKPFLKQYVSFYTDQVPGPTAKFNDTADEQNGVQTPVSASVIATYKNDPESPNSQLCYIPGTDYISSLGDLSVSYIDEFHLNRGIRLLDLRLGSDHPQYYNNLIVPSKFELKDSIGDMETKIHKPLLQKVVLNHLRRLETSIDLSASAKLEEFRALDTPITGAKFAPGAPLHTIHLPRTVNSLSLMEASDLTNLITSAPQVAYVDSNTGELIYNPANTYRGLYIQDVTDTNTSGIGCTLSSLIIQGGHLRYGSYKLLKRLVDLKLGAVTGNTLNASLTDVEWTPFELVPYGEAQGAGPYYRLTDHSTYEIYNGNNSTEWNELTLNEKIYTRNNSIDTSAITSLDILDTFLADYNRPVGETQQFMNTSGSINRTVPTLSGQMYVENTASNPIDEAELTNVYRQVWPDLVIRAAHIGESYIAKYVQVLDNGKEEEIDIIRYSQSGANVQPTLTTKIPAKQYHDFLGWSLTKGSATADFATFDAVTRTCTIINPQTFSSNNTVIVLYAVFQNHPYDIKFYDIDGTTVLYTTHSTYGEKVKVPSALPVTDESGLAQDKTYKFVGYSRTLIAPSAVTDRVIEQNVIDVTQINVTKDLSFYCVFREQSVFEEPTDISYFNTSVYTYTDEVDPTQSITGVLVSPKTNNSLSGKVTIPNEINGQPVVGITGFGSSDFDNRQAITHLYFMDNGSNFRIFSADSCRRLTTLTYVDWPASTRVIGNAAFRQDSQLRLSSKFNAMHLVTIEANAFNQAFGSIDNDVSEIHFAGSFLRAGVDAMSYFNLPTATGEREKIKTMNVVFGGPNDPSNFIMTDQDATKTHFLHQNTWCWGTMTIYCTGLRYQQLALGTDGAKLWESWVNEANGYFINAYYSWLVYPCQQDLDDGHYYMWDEEMSDWQYDGSGNRILAERNNALYQNDDTPYQVRTCPVLNSNANS